MTGWRARVRAACADLADAVDAESASRLARDTGRAVGEALGAGPVHRRRLEAIDTRIVVSGVRGKSSAVRWLHDALDERGHDVMAKVTGDDARVLRNGAVTELDRDGQVRLYENERVLGAAAAADSLPEVLVLENQGIRPYTTRLVNERFARPDVVLLTNVREDHLDTLGGDRVQIARGLARGVPPGTRVICGEPDERLREYIAAELERRSAPVSFVDPPPADRHRPGAEVVHGVDAVLEAVGEEPLAEPTVAAHLETLQPAWRRLPGGLVHDAAAVNDVQSTELVRRALVAGLAAEGDDEPVVEPVVNLRSDRRGRTASFIRYLSRLHAEGAISRVHLVGDHQRLFAANTDVPTRHHDTGEASAAAVLDAALAAGRPVILMGNTVTGFMRSLAAEIDRRATDESPTGQGTGAPADREWGVTDASSSVSPSPGGDG